MGSVVLILSRIYLYLQLLWASVIALHNHRHFGCKLRQCKDGFKFKFNVHDSMKTFSLKCFVDEFLKGALSIFHDKVSISSNAQND
jgi:hypothetical protein